MSNYRKIYKEYYNTKINKGWQVHHIDWNCENNNPLNLIAIPRRLHSIIHSHFGYIKRNEIESVLDIFLSIKNIDNFSKGALINKLSKSIKKDPSKKAVECFSGQNRGIVNHSYHVAYKGGHSYFI
jgi:hypothetical protein